MKIYFEYGRSAFALPAVSKKLLARAGKTELKLLVCLASVPELCEKYDELADGLAQEIKVSRSALDSALSFWIGAGIISKERDDGTAIPAEETAVSEKLVPAEEEPPKRSRVTELPQYTGDEFTKVMERRGELSGLIEEAQNVLGKVFNITETQLLVSISEGLGLDDEYVLGLLAYCKQIGKANLRYVEKIACSFYDKGICTAKQLEEYLRTADMLASAESKIRKIFGIGDRAFTSKESKYINDWITVYKFDFEVIKLAYEDTVNATSKPSMSYANKVLESWFAEGYKSVSDVEKSKEKKKGSRESAQATSFNVDDFFNAAINKGFGEDKQGG
ncbi:MAG: DnaD domain protein [Clostridia bacterium]|nr:DnaD domain protein [Clostridia bacterium]